MLEIWGVFIFRGLEVKYIEIFLRRILNVCGVLSYSKNGILVFKDYFIMIKDV